MEGTNKRFRQLREAFEKTQEEWAEIMGLSRSGISEIEAGRRNVTEKHIKFVCLESINGKMINGDWIRTGEGNMFIEFPEEDEYFKAATLLSKNNDTMAMKAVIEYGKLDDPSKKAIWDFVHKLAEK